MTLEKGFTIPVLDHGYVRYIDHMGDDKRILEAARISYKSPSKGDDQDKRLINYLWKNKHCYHPSMEVLTIEGWKKWEDCREYDEYLIPNPITKEYSIEKLKLEIFDTDEELFCYKNNRMSYMVTANHRMWFKSKNTKDFRIFKVEEKPNWGHYESIVNYILKKDSTDYRNTSEEFFKLIGFYLGDGFLRSVNTIGFRLKKQRKIKFLTDVLNNLDIPFDIKDRENSVKEISFNIPSLFEIFVNLNNKSDCKQINISEIKNLSVKQLNGLYCGLINSDGSIKKDRNQIEFSSKSEKLIRLFELLSAILNFDAHRCKSFDGIYSSKVYCNKGRTSLESRKQYHYKEYYKGKVYCVTSSTGLLAVRGGNDKFGFICGNTSPFEMVKITLNIKLPIFIMRQYVRHRMQNLNEVSARYTELPNEFYIPKSWRPQDTKNKQGSIATENWNPEIVPVLPMIDYEGNPFPVENDTASELFKRTCHRCYEVYQELLRVGIAREMARMVLPVNIYTEIYACWDLKNLLHFITLRDDGHAQAEIQDYSKAIKTIAREVAPWTLEAYEKYKWKLIEE